MSDPSYGDLVAAALQADAEVARAEIRAQGLVCPSCEVNLIDLPDGHALVSAGGDGVPWTAECRNGAVVTLAPSSPMSGEAFATWQAVATISVWDDFRRREAESFRAIIGEGPTNFTGLIDILKGSERPSS